MSRQILNTGGAANDGSGDTLRDASAKINSNFQELYQSITLGADSGGVTLAYLENYVDGAVDSALDGVNPVGIVENAQAINSLDARVE